MKPALTEAVCVRCGAAHDVGGVLYTCEQCGGNLVLRYDVTTATQQTTISAIKSLY